jgi:hypothetical protein
MKFILSHRLSTDHKFGYIRYCFNSRCIYFWKWELSIQTNFKIG